MQVTNVSLTSSKLNAQQAQFGHGAKELTSNTAATGLVTTAAGVGSGYAFSYGLPASVTSLGAAMKAATIADVFAPFTAAIGLGAVALYGAYSLVKQVLGSK